MENELPNHLMYVQNNCERLYKRLINEVYDNEN